MNKRERTKGVKKPIIILKEGHVHFRDGIPFLYIGFCDDQEKYPLAVFDIHRKSLTFYELLMQMYVSKSETISWSDWLKDNPDHETDFLAAGFGYDVSDSKKRFVKQKLRDYKLKKILFDV